MTIKGLKKVRRGIAVALVMVIILFILLLCSRDNRLTVSFLDIGQGDATLILLPSSVQILIDGGSDNRVLGKLGDYMPFYDKTIEYVILSHPHSDHLTGVVSVLERYKVGLFIHNGIKRDLPIYERLQRVLVEKSMSEFVIDKPGVLLIDDETILEFLFPDHSLVDDEQEDFNASSIINMIVFGESSFLFTGDTTREIEQHLLNKGVNLSADVLKVAHQGSKTSTGVDFLRAVAPDYAVIMVGENDFGHPHLRTLKTLSDESARVLRTDRMGDIVFVSDGKTLELRD